MRWVTRAMGVGAWTVGMLACAAAMPPPSPGDFPGVEGGALDSLDPTPELASSPVCARACLRLRALGCPEGSRPDGGETCYRTCERLELGGHFTLRPSCIAAAMDVGAVRACGAVRCAR
jgi:hypothetical protein